MELLLLWLVCAIIGAILGSTRQRGGAGFLLGALFGPLGIIMVLLMGKPRRDYSDEISRTPVAASRPPPVPGAIPSEIVTALLDLKKLLEAGIISEAEFESRKKAILATKAPTESSVRY